MQCKKIYGMTFDKILDNNTLWVVRYDGEADNALQMLFEQWSNPEWLVDFFLANMSDLESYFKITDINQAIFDTIDDNQRIQCLILDLSPGVLYHHRWCHKIDAHNART